MKQKINLGVVCLARNTFDYEAAAKLYEGIIEQLNALPNVQLCAVEGLVMEVEQAIAAGKMLYERKVDGVIIISGTFHLGHLALEIKKAVNVPLLLWGLDELPYNGGKIRLNSVCGVNLNASNLYKSGYSDFTYCLGEKPDENWIDAVRIITALKSARIGILGGHAQGFFNLNVDELALYKKLGTAVEHYEQAELWNEEFDAADEAKYNEKIRKTFDTCALNEVQIEKVAQLCARLKAFLTRRNLTALALRCWPEFAKGYGVAPCAAMSILQSEGYLLGCEGDIDCTLTMLAHRAVGAETPFMADLSQVNVKENYALMWHCGVAPCNLCDGVCTPTLDTYFAGGKGVTVGFVMRSGEFSVARLDSVNGNYRLFTQKGVAVPMEKLLTGTYAKVIFNSPMQQVLDSVVYSGIAHHVSFVYGDYSGAFATFARLCNIPIVG